MLNETALAGADPERISAACTARHASAHLAGFAQKSRRLALGRSTKKSLPGRFANDNASKKGADQSVPLKPTLGAAHDRGNRFFFDRHVVTMIESAAK